MWTKFDEAVSAAFKDGSGSLDAYTAARTAVKHSATFDSCFIGVMAACTPKEIWAEAIECAKAGYASYRAL